jgi:hypothetical protein
MRRGTEPGPSISFRLSETIALMDWLSPLIGTLVSSRAVSTRKGRAAAALGPRPPSFMTASARAAGSLSESRSICARTSGGVSAGIVIFFNDLG